MWELGPEGFSVLHAKRKQDLDKRLLLLTLNPHNRCLDLEVTNKQNQVAYRVACKNRNLQSVSFVCELFTLEEKSVAVI